MRKYLTCTKKVTDVQLIIASNQISFSKYYEQAYLLDDFVQRFGIRMMMPSYRRRRVRQIFVFVIIYQNLVTQQKSKTKKLNRLTSVRVPGCQKLQMTA